MEFLLQKGTLVLPKVSDPPPIMGKDKDQFCKFHHLPKHMIEDCFDLNNIIQDTMDKELLDKGGSSGVLKNTSLSILKEVSFVNIFEMVVPIKD